MKNYLLALFLCPVLFATANLRDPLSVLIIGGGPAGLSSAIEAVNHGCSVTVVEKREEYSRAQPIGITSNSVRLLKKWNVFIPEIQMSNMDPEGDDFSGVLRINTLEKHLARKCEELGVKRILGAFQGFGSGQTASIKTEEEELMLPYDVLVGSDGFHSKTRNALAIPMHHFGSAKGANVIIPDFMNKRKGSTLLVKQDENFGRLIRTSMFTVVSMQNPSNASKDQVMSFLKSQGWEREIKAIDQGHTVEFIENIPITLAQAQLFCDLEKSVVLLGDAVVSLSFVFGDGLNTAFSSAEVLGDFLVDLPRDKNKAFQDFNESMKNLTDKVVRRSSILFNIESLN